MMVKATDFLAVEVTRCSALVAGGITRLFATGVSVANFFDLASVAGFEPLVGLGSGCLWTWRPDEVIEEAGFDEVLRFGVELRL